MGQRSPLKATCSERWDFSCIGKVGGALPGILGKGFSRQRNSRQNFRDRAYSENNRDLTNMRKFRPCSQQFVNSWREYLFEGFTKASILRAASSRNITSK